MTRDIAQLLMFERQQVGGDFKRLLEKSSQWILCLELPPLLYVFFLGPQKDALNKLSKSGKKTGKHSGNNHSGNTKTSASCDLVGNGGCYIYTSKTMQFCLIRHYFIATIHYRKSERNCYFSMAKPLDSGGSY